MRYLVNPLRRPFCQAIQMPGIVEDTVIIIDFVGGRFPGPGHVDTLYQELLESGPS